MSTARSAFTEAIEEHLALKKQNATLEATMPLARYDVGDPLDRYPGGPSRAADAGTVFVADDVEAAATAAQVDAAAMVGPSPEQAMEAASALEPTFADRPFEPLNGMAPMLSLVEDIDEDAPIAGAETPAPVEASSADVLRFPGGVGPRDEAVEEPTETPEPTVTEGFGDDQLPLQVQGFGAAAPTTSGDDHVLVTEDAPTGEQPVLVIDTDEPLATSAFDEPVEPSRPARKRPRFFGMGGRKKQQKQEAGDNWFTDGPRDFNWD